jgi:hypothetical protein
MPRREGSGRPWSAQVAARPTTKGSEVVTHDDNRPDNQGLAGDGDAFERLTEPHRRELLVHC